MSTNKKQCQKTRNYAFVFYPDCPEHMELMSYLVKTYKYVYILHDKDVDENGVVKKSHYHFICMYSNPRSLKGVLSEYEKYKINHAEPVSCMDSYIKYMVHDTLDCKNKYQYDKTELQGDVQVISRAFAKSGEEVEIQGLSELISVIDTMPCPSIKLLTQYVIDNQSLLPAFKSYNYLLCRIISECRENIKISKNDKKDLTNDI